MSAPLTFAAVEADPERVAFAAPFWAAWGIRGVGAYNCERAARTLAEVAVNPPPLSLLRLFIAQVVRAHLDAHPTADPARVVLIWQGGADWTVGTPPEEAPA